MNLIKQLKEDIDKWELHASGAPRHVRHGRSTGTVVKGYLYNSDRDEEIDVDVEYEHERADPGDHYTPSSDAQVHVISVTREGGGQVPLESIDTHDFEMDMHDHHSHDHEDPRY